MTGGWAWLTVATSEKLPRNYSEEQSPVNAYTEAVMGFNDTVEEHRGFAASLLFKFGSVLICVFF